MALLARRIATETVKVQERTGIDGQGAPAYGAAEEIEARVTENVEVDRDAEGTAVTVALVLLIPPDESPVPEKEWRVELADERQFIVTRAHTSKRLNGTVAHHRVECRDE